MSFEEEIAELQDTFLTEAEEEIENLESYLIQLEEDTSDLGIIGNILRIAHTLKGSSAAVNFERFAAFAHQFDHALIAGQPAVRGQREGAQR